MNDYHFLIICAFRYCLGRKSSSVGRICDIIEKKWNKLSKNDKKLIIKEIKAYQEMWSFTEMDKYSWDKILKMENK